MTVCGVYEIVHTASGTRYVGQSSNITARWKNHRRELKIGRAQNGHLQRAWNKHGHGSFEFHVILRCHPRDLTFYEQLVADKYRSSGLYNIGYFVDSPMRGRSLTPDHRRKIGEKSRGRKHSHETLLKIREANLGKVLSPEHRKKIGESLRNNKNAIGYSHSIEARRRISDAMKKRELSPDHRQRIGNAHRGMKRSPETRRRISEAKQGQIVSADARRKMSESGKGRKQTPQQIRKRVEATRATKAHLALLRTEEAHP